MLCVWWRVELSCIVICRFVVGVVGKGKECERVIKREGVFERE